MKLNYSYCRNETTRVVREMKHHRICRLGPVLKPIRANSPHWHSDHDNAAPAMRQPRLIRALMRIFLSGLGLLTVKSNV